MKELIVNHPLLVYGLFCLVFIAGGLIILLAATSGINDGRVMPDGNPKPRQPRAQKTGGCNEILD